MPEPIVLVNRGTDQITLEIPELEEGGLPKRDAKGSPIFREFLLGSQEDVGNAAAPQPEIEVSVEDWARLKAQPAVAGLVREQKIAAYRRGAEV